MALRRLTRPLFIPALCGIGALALGVRLLGFEEVFRGSDVVLRGYDSYYHARRALYSVVNFPEVLQRDPYLNYPYGSAVPWPPLYDALIAAVAKLCGGDEAALERVAALAPPLWGALTLIPVFLLGRLLAGPRAGLLAAALLAVFEANVMFSRVGAADHHAFAALLSMGLLAVTAHIVTRSAPGAGMAPRAAAHRDIDDARRAHGPASRAAVHEDTEGGTRGRHGPGAGLAAWAGLCALRVGLVLSIPGSVMVLAVVETGLFAATVLEPDAGRRARLRRRGAAAAAVTAAVLLPFAFGAATTADYGVTPSYFSTFHPLLFACIAALHGVSEAFERVRGPATSARRLARAAVAGAVLTLALVVALPSLRQGVEYGLRFLSGTHAAGDRVLEERPLFAASLAGGLSPDLAHRMFGYTVYLLPLALLLLLGEARRDTERRPSLGLTAGWLVFFGAGALTAVRFTNELAGAAAVGVAVLAAAAARLPARRRSVSKPASAHGVALRAGALLAAGLLLAPALSVHAGRARATARAWNGAPPHATLELAMYRFARLVRDYTPETRGFFDPQKKPEFGVFAWSGIGHHLHYVARRPTPADNFGPVIGRDARNFRLSDALYRFRRPQRALRVLERLGTPYLVTTELGWRDPELLLSRLHRDDGSARGERAAIGRLRLVADSQARLPTGPRFKLFELVPGARLELAAPPGTPVEVHVELRTNTGRRFVWSSRGVSDGDGRARLRVPYATRGALAQARATGPATIVAGGEMLRVEIREPDVRQGSAVDVRESASRPDSAEEERLP